MLCVLRPNRQIKEGYFVLQVLSDAESINIFPNKERPENKIDPVVALIMAMNSIMSGRDPTSVYETRGVLTFG